jgi:hypothetical protein
MYSPPYNRIKATEKPFPLAAEKAFKHANANV